MSILPVVYLVIRPNLAMRFHEMDGGSIGCTSELRAFTDIIMQMVKGKKPSFVWSIELVKGLTASIKVDGFRIRFQR
jgi:hypothetical protein